MTLLTFNFPIGQPVIFEGEFATVTGYDRFDEKVIIEFCDHRDGKFRTADPKNLIIDHGSAV